MKNENSQKRRFSKKTLLFLLVALLLILIGASSLLLMKGCSQTKLSSFEDLLSCLRTSKAKYQEGYTPFKDYFSSEVTFINDESNLSCDMEYQKEPFLLHKRVGSELDVYSLKEGIYYRNESQISENDVQNEIGNEQCGYSYYLSFTADHFDYLIQTIGDLKALDASNFSKMEIDISDLSTYSCEFETNDHLIAFRFSNHNLEKYREKTSLFSIENSFAFSKEKNE